MDQAAPTPPPGDVPRSVASLPDLVFRMDADLRHFYVSANVEALTGIPLPRWIGRTGREVGLDPASCDVLEEAAHRVFAEARAEVLHLSQAHREYRCRVVPEVASSGAVLSVLVIAEDVTEAKRAAEAAQEALREAAREAERRARELEAALAARDEALAERDQTVAERQLALDSAHLGWFSFDRRTGETTHDQRYADIFGVPGPVRFPRRDLLQLVHPDDRDRVVAALDAALDPADARPYASEYRVLRPDGALRWIEGRGLATFEGHGPERRVRKFVGIVADVTERKEGEAALRELDRRKNDFLAVLSHELRNPLAPIRNALFVLDQAAPGSDAALRARGVLHRQTDHLSRLVDDLLDVARIGRGKIDLRRERVDAREVARRSVDDARHLASERGIALHLDDGPGPLWVDADPARLSQMMGNLVSNALKFTPAGGRVDVALAADGASCRIAVRDTGEGIAPDELERIFAPFAQSERTRGRAQGGLGLGLALVRDLAALHGGTVRAASAGAGRGAEFVLCLPLSSSAPAPRPARATRTRPGPGLSVLVVEDNEDQGATLADVLALQGHAARVVGTGKAALTEALRQPPDVLLCDVGLPDMSGLDVIRELRGSPSGRTVYAVALTGFAQAQDREDARRAGFDAHLAKPADLERLAALMGEAAARRAASDVERRS